MLFDEYSGSISSFLSCILTTRPVIRSPFLSTTTAASAAQGISARRTATMTMRIAARQCMINSRVWSLVSRSLFDIAARDEAKEVRPDTRPQARKNRRCIGWNTWRIFSGRARRRWSRIVCRSRTVNNGQAPMAINTILMPMPTLVFF